VLEVIATEEGCALPRRVQLVEATEQVHQRPHKHIHITKVDEDCHQRDGVRRQVMELKDIVLQKHEEERGKQGHEPR
jgi:hypothetical protein